MTECNRCYAEVEQTCLHKSEDEFGETKEFNLCWDCDHDVINGGDIREESHEIQLRREEEEYLFDPINNLKPRWMK